MRAVPGLSRREDFSLDCLGMRAVPGLSIGVRAVPGLSRHDGSTGTV